ncbi:MAG TPA: DUF4910 domain-containing protein [Alphaproteobacteria bacterium]|jgi:aminopeptidase-like protein
MPFDKPQQSEVEAYFDRLFPLLRSITGDGVRKTHDILSELMPLERIEIPTGTRVFDWTIPKEWKCRDAYVIDPQGRRILDVNQNNLHLVNYSMPFRGRLSRKELDEHLYSRPDLPQAIPYVTSYYEPRWGFCLADEQRRALPDGEYEVVIDTDLVDGSLTISEAVLPGRTGLEVLISTYTCHPSMANNELSGPLVSAFLCRSLSVKEDRKLTYRFVLVPESIGSIAYLHLRGRHLVDRTVAGVVLTCIGDRSHLTYKKSRRGDALIDRAASACLRHFDADTEFLDFYPYGSDEKHYCSPGFNLPIGTLMRTPPAKYPGYHTSLDNKDFISFAAIANAVEALQRLMTLLEENETYINLYPFGEPQLGSRGLVSTLSRTENRSAFTVAVKWVLNLADGSHDLLQIADRSNLDPSLIFHAAARCREAGLIAPATSDRTQVARLP